MTVIAPTLPAGTTDLVMRRLFPKADPFATDPAGWVKQTLGEHFWSKQVEVAESVRDNRFTAVQSAHGTGKSFAASRLIAWWMATHEPGEAFVVSTAPSQPQVEAILWREIGRAHRRGGLLGRITAGGVPQWKLGQEIIGFGRKPADYVDVDQARAAFQGIHARYVLIVMDEAAGIPHWLWEAVESLATNDDARVLAIGNPDSPTSEFARVCQNPDYNAIRISAFDTPAFTGEEVPRELLDQLTSRQWVEERKRRWGEESPLYMSKVLGVFPPAADDMLIPLDLITEAQAREIVPARAVRPHYGVDVARSGSDESAIMEWKDGRARGRYSKAGIGDTMKLARLVAGLLDRGRGSYTADIDVIGVGAGVFDRLREQGYNVRGFDASERARRPDRYKNRRAEAWWKLREKFMDGLIDLDPNDLETAAQLSNVRWWINKSGQVQVESKEEMRKRGLSSPDRADALVMAALSPPAWSPRKREDAEPVAKSLTAGLLKERM